MLEPFGKDFERPLFKIPFSAIIISGKEKHYDIMKEKYLKLFGENFISGISFDESIKDK